MRVCVAFGVVALAALFGGRAIAGDAEELKSGLELGAFPASFNVEDCTGPAKGKSLCYRCAYKSRPVVAIFTRTLDEPVAKLIKAIDESVAENSRSKRMAAFVVLLTDDPDAARGKLVALAERHKVEHVPLTIHDGSAGPADYQIADEAQVSVMMWVKSDVKVNWACRPGQLDEQGIKGLLESTGKILE